ncbi:hypothetical protein ACFFX1_55380 [Dactylosporangium sucinum]|uniref:Uncharacterized protein n=1 Tax=Dactylosporangium sucinum TaxID=1424081 RepID=A0A917U2I8_9ACTN|nr:hypothetical protein [Dactylosporangium sucinum]GGM52734.1 hypothetical protein GCM10007977_062880 [Dactylosporangium sucinum]
MSDVEFPAEVQAAAVEAAVQALAPYATDPHGDVLLNADRAAAKAVMAALPVLAAELRFARQLSAEVDADAHRHRAILRRLMAAHGLEDPTWAGLSEREKAVLRAADEQMLAGSPRRLPTGMDTA